MSRVSFVGCLLLTFKPGNLGNVEHAAWQLHHELVGFGSYEPAAAGDDGGQSSTSIVYDNQPD